MNVWMNFDSRKAGIASLYTKREGIMVKKIRKAVVVGIISYSALTHALSSEVSVVSAPEQVVIKALAKVQSERVRKIISQNYLNQLFYDTQLAKFFPEISSQFATLNGIIGENQLELARANVAKDIDNFKDLVVDCFPKALAYAATPDFSGKSRDLAQAKLKAALDEFTLMTYLVGTDVPKTIPALKREVCGIYEDEDQDFVFSLAKAFFKDGFTGDFPTKNLNFTYPDKTKKGANTSVTKSVDSSGLSKLYSTVVCDRFYDSRNSVLRSNIEEPKQQYKEMMCWDTPERINALFRLLAKNFNLYLEYKNDKSTAPSYEMAMLRVLDTYNVIARARRNNERSYIELQRVAMLFAKLSDAGKVNKDAELDEIEQAAENVSGVLLSYIESDDPIYHKRDQNALFNNVTIKEYDYEGQQIVTKKFFSWCTTLFFCRDNIFVGGYFGIARVAVSPSRPSGAHDSLRAFGPIGLEYKIYTNSLFTFSIDYAPIDIGNAISNELLEEDYSVSLKDIMATSYFISIASRKYPVALLLGRQDRVPVGDGETDSGNFVSLSFELPLARIW